MKPPNPLAIKCPACNICYWAGNGRCIYGGPFGPVSAVTVAVIEAARERWLQGPTARVFAPPRTAGLGPGTREIPHAGVEVGHR